VRPRFANAHGGPDGAPSGPSRLRPRGVSDRDLARDLVCASSVTSSGASPVSSAASCARGCGASRSR